MTDDERAKVRERAKAIAALAKSLALIAKQHAELQEAIRRREQ